MKPALQVNTRPAYHAHPEPILPGCGERRAGMFCIFETREGSETYLFTMSNRGDRMTNLLRRGIPAEDARALFYSMDGN